MIKILNFKNKKLVLIISLSIFLAVGLSVGGYFLFRQKKKTTQYWLNDFSMAVAGFSSLSNRVDRDISFERRIEIFENGILVASYFQSVKIHSQDEGIVAKLIVEEKYPTSESKEFDTYDEYWLVGNRMYTLRCVFDDRLTSSFSSSIDIFVQLANKNIGGAKYNLDENNFDTLSIIEEEGTHKMKAKIKNDKVREFAGEANDSISSEVELNVNINKALELNSFDLTFNDASGDVNKVTLNVLSSQIIEIDDWIKKLL